LFEDGKSSLTCDEAEIDKKLLEVNVVVNN